MALRPHPQLHVLEWLCRRVDDGSVPSNLLEQLMCHIPRVKSRFTGPCVRVTKPVKLELLMQLCITLWAVFAKPFIFVSKIKNLNNFQKIVNEKNAAGTM